MRLLRVTAALSAVALLLCADAHGAALRKAGMPTTTAGVDSIMIGNPNREHFSRPVWVCQDSTTLASGSSYTFIPWVTKDGDLHTFQGYEILALPLSGAARLELFLSGREEGVDADTMWVNVSPDSTVKSLTQKVLFDSLVITPLTAKVRLLIRAQ